MKQRFNRITVIVSAILLGGFLLLIYGPQSDDPISHANFEQIKKGTPQADVEYLLGPPKERGNFREGTAFMSYGLWQGERGTIKITLDGDGQVVSGYFTPSQSILSRVRAWFGR